MSELPDVTKGSFLHKKTAGIQNVYLLGAVAVGIGIIAYRMKSSATPASTTTDTTAASAVSAGGDGIPTADFTDAGLVGTPTSTVVTTPTDNTLPNASIKDNASWVNAGIQWLVANGKATGTDAQQALTLYISGGDRTYDQNTLVNDVIKQFGPPPDALTQLGSVGAAPAQRQFTTFPGVHTVKGSNDNTFPILSQLYYNRNDDNSRDLLQAHNTGIANLSSFSVGTKVNIPIYEAPKFYTATSTTRTAAAIAAKNGITTAALSYYNDGGAGSTPALKFPVSAGTRVRVG